MTIRLSGLPPGATGEYPVNDRNVSNKTVRGKTTIQSSRSNRSEKGASTVVADIASISNKSVSVQQLSKTIELISSDVNFKSVRSNTNNELLHSARDAENSIVNINSTLDKLELLSEKLEGLKSFCESNEDIDLAFKEKLSSSCKQIINIARGDSKTVFMHTFEIVNELEDEIVSTELLKSDSKALAIETVDKLLNFVGYLTVRANAGKELQKQNISNAIIARENKSANDSVSDVVNIYNIYRNHIIQGGLI